MKKFSQVFEANKPKLDIQDDTINYIDSANLKKYLEICDKFISNECKSIIKYLIDHNDTYISELSSDGDENALAGFYNNWKPSNKSNELKELYKNISILNKKNRLMEIPVFQSKEQFEAIINKTESPDSVILDLTSEAGRNQIAKKYEPLIHKIAKQFMGKSELSYEDLISAGNVGLIHAMNKYGKKSNKNVADLETIVGKTFTQYAAFMIRISILEDIKNLSQIVRIPISQQNAERRETGRNTKSNTVSGDKEISSSGDEGNKSLFDYIGGTDNATRGIDNEDVEKLWKKFFKKLEEKFDKTTLDIWYSSFGVNGHEKMKKKDIAAKYGLVPSNISYYLYRVNTFIKTDKKMMEMMNDILELMTECKHDEDTDYDPEEGIHVKIQENNEE